MTPDEFEALLLLHGSDFDRWPERQATEARALMATDRKAQSLWSEMQRLDDSLSRTSPSVPLTAGELGTLLNLPRGQGRRLANHSVFHWRMAGAAVTLALVVTGFASGFVQSGAPGADTDNFLISFAGGGHLFWTLM